MHRILFKNAVSTAFTVIVILAMLFLVHVRVFIPASKSLEEPPDEPESTEQVEQVLPDPCELESVVCKGEDGFDDVMKSVYSDISPCAVSTLPENGCTPEVRRQLELESMIRRMAQEAGYPEERAVAMAWCESTMNEFAKNPKSSAKGLYQFTDTTWEWIKAEGHQFDAVENIKQFLIWDQIHPEWWECE